MTIAYRKCPEEVRNRNSRNRDEILFVLFFFLLFSLVWSKIGITVEESGRKGFKVVGKWLRVIAYVHGRIQPHSGCKGQIDSPVQIPGTFGRGICGNEGA